MRLINFLPFFLFTSFITSIPLNNEVAATFDTFEKRDYAVLTEFFKVIKDTNVAPSLIKLLGGNKLTEPILVKAIVAFVKIQNLDDLLVAVDKSGLTVDIVLQVLQDSKFFPGVYTIVDGLKNGASSTPSQSLPNTGALTQDVGQVAQSFQKFQGDGLGDVLGEISGSLGIGTGTGIFSFLNPAFNLFGLSGTGSRGGQQISLSPSATAQATGATKTGTSSTGTGTGTGTSTPTTKASSTATSTATSTPTSTPTGSSSGSSSSSGGWLSGLFNQVRGWFSKREFIDEPVLSKRDNEILNQLVDSLAKSGLAMQVVVALVEDSGNYPFVRDLIKELVKSKAIPIDTLQSALDSSNLLNNGVIGVLKSPDLGITIT